MASTVALALVMTKVKAQTTEQILPEDNLDSIALRGHLKNQDLLALLPVQSKIEQQEVSLVEISKKITKLTDNLHNRGDSFELLHQYLKQLVGSKTITVERKTNSKPNHLLYFFEGHLVVEIDSSPEQESFVYLVTAYKFDDNNNTILKTAFAETKD